VPFLSALGVVYDDALYKSTFTYLLYYITAILSARHCSSCFLTINQSIKLYLPNLISQIIIQKETWQAARTGNSPTKLATLGWKDSKPRMIMALHKHNNTTIKYDKYYTTKNSLLTLNV